MSDIWLPGFEQCIGSHSRGGTMVPNAPPRWTGHTTEGLSRSTAGAARAHPTPPHCWVCLPSHPYKPRWRGQIVPLNRSAFALKHNAGDPETNRAGAIQVEIEGFAAQAGGWSSTDLDWLTDMVVGPMCAATGVKPTITWTGTSRMSWSQWASFNGLHTHRNVPGNTHTDAPIDLGYISRRLISGGSPTPLPPEIHMAFDSVAQNADGRWEWFKTESGALRDSWQVAGQPQPSGWATVDSTHSWVAGSLRAVRGNDGCLNVFGEEVTTGRRMVIWQKTPNGTTGWSSVLVYNTP